MKTNLLQMPIKKVFELMKEKKIPFIELETEVGKILIDSIEKTIVGTNVLKV